MNTLNIGSLLYISFRLAPFILISYFTISSLFNQDFKGLIYLAGLIITSFIAILIGNQFPSIYENSGDSADNTYENITKVCNLMTISKSGPLSNLPLSIVVFSYTFGYLLVPIVKYGLITQNIPTIVIFPILIISDILWQITNTCSTTAAVFSGLIVAGLAGVGWSFFIDSTKMSSLQYFNGISNKSSCSVPTKQFFKCAVKRKINPQQPPVQPPVQPPEEEEEDDQLIGQPRTSGGSGVRNYSKFFDVKTIAEGTRDSKALAGNIVEESNEFQNE
jgi:hypothetical protein